ncbi:hypothetical protein K458DRAFT_303892 [Lentithecium fluviatile CBS 122367]|uniref:U6 small nuclear RNA (adenine-(43)-N(6))-methyltransferase n=1 Tax=Lentithecium fluviatile CBS 122367 TaxID=1168545 RepID=A0A6G1J0L4_9PLEO|nr:hypothetical protein K458DRAFT_303892 [Lentithecium fluviatile CBS 122367]
MSSNSSAQFVLNDTVDFTTLAKEDEAFSATWQKSSGQLDFQDPATVTALSKAILRTHFDLHLHIPADRLCPPIPNRWSYVAWMQGLLDSTSPGYCQKYDPNRQVTGLDIGTGASAIYTMLCLKTRPNWTMCATDIDKKSFDSAVRNLTLNGLITRTKMLQTIESNTLIPLQHLGVKKLDFTICNPPFFENEEDMRHSIKGEGKGWKPNAVCTGSVGEMVCAGGDLGFVGRIIDESLVLRDKVTWYSSMLGKLSSAKAIVGQLKKHAVNNWAVGCIDTGGATKRWIVAWSFGDHRPRNEIARIEKIANEFLPFPTEYRITLPSDTDPPTTKDKLNAQLSTLDLSWTWNPDALTGVGRACQNVWKRAYRREHDWKKKEMAAAGGLDSEMGGDEGDVKVELAFRVSVNEGAREIVLEWLRGNDQVLWESFCGMVHRVFKRG